MNKEDALKDAKLEEASKSSEARGRLGGPRPEMSKHNVMYRPAGNTIEVDEPWRELRGPVSHWQ